MCGIFGLVRKRDSSFSDDCLRKTITSLFILSSSRGKEASGFALRKDREITVFKTPDDPKNFISSAYYQKNISANNLAGVNAFMGHSRMVTNGTEYLNINNQPVIKNNIAAVHNGIIVNDAEIWRKYPDEKRTSQLDSEVIPTIIRNKMDSGKSLYQSLSAFYEEIYGMASIALMFADLENMVLATNNGSLHYNISKTGREFIFASEHFILKEICEKGFNNKFFATETITKLYPNHALCINILEMTTDAKAFGASVAEQEFTNVQKRAPINMLDESSSEKEFRLNLSPFHLPLSFEQHYNNCRERIAALKRCSKCLLPSTFPGIYYDERGVCNLCNSYQPRKMKGEAELLEIAETIKKNKRDPDCVVAFSGGRDSSYSLHYLKKLGLNPLAFSYDWGMITDLARRNQSRICASLGIEHILVSADIRMKRKYIRLNVEAWLKRPSLGTIPLFMAGDKQYYYYAELIKKQNGIDTLFMGENHLEKTGFKTAFSGAKIQESGYASYHLSSSNKVRMIAFYLKEYMMNPSYLNSSLFDTAGAFLSFYWLKHDYINIFDYLKWSEEQISDTIIKEYDWEISPDTSTTWRIGDGTAPFYNYIYYTVAGFTENDTFRSNQIREGVLSRENALAFSERENYPRWESIKWYCDAINIDFQKTIQIINSIPPLY